MDSLEALAARARDGDRAALESLVAGVQRDVYALALRFLWHREDAEDATQEILVRVVTHVGAFEGRSSFRTWVYRIAVNTLLTLRRKRMEERALSFEDLGADLERGLSDRALGGTETRGVHEELLLEEVKVGCTQAMLLALDRDHRMAYILGEILELDHDEASELTGVTPAAFRKRLSRARAELTTFMKRSCGLFEPGNACRCRRRVGAAIALGRVDPQNLLFATNLERARRFPEVLAEVRRLEETRRAAALYRSHALPGMREDFLLRLRALLDGSGMTGWRASAD